MYEASPRRIACLITIVPGACVIAAACLIAWRRWIVLRAWPPATGVVVSGRQMIQPWNQGWASGGKASNEAMVATRFAAGSKHELRYDPANPAKIHCDVGLTARFFAPALILALVGAFFILVGAVLILFLPKNA